ncbi:MAG: UvrB/UvrC motif-containing protein [Saccharofermentans sp.]|nr:UvrB/UvrC motif-containing protein [Saccharofermentans sp.]
MRCERCGGPLGGRLVKYNGMIICEKCARDIGVADSFRNAATLFDQSFAILGELSNAIMSGGSDLDFANANTQIRCPRCKTTLRDVETNGIVGCIECYNTFNETILKDILKRQGSSEYKGRKPGTGAELEEVKENADEAAAAAAPQVAKPSINQAPVEAQKKEEAKAESKAELLEKIKRADLGMVSDEDLQEAMLIAAKNEEYDLAVRLRDELKSRKGDN